MNRKLRMGMVGGGRGTFIGNVHRMAMRWRRFPTVDDGVAGVAFIKARVDSSASGQKWLPFPKE